MRRVGFCLAVVGTLATAQEVKQDAKSEIQFAGRGAWQKQDEGSSEAASRLQVSSQVSVVLRGSLNNRISYRLTQRVFARTLDQAAARLVGTASISTAAGLAIVSAQSSLANSTLEIEVPRQVRLITVDGNRDIEVDDVLAAVQARTPSGKIQGDSIGGFFVANTGGGNIRLGRIGGRVECSTSAGSISIDSAGGDVRCQTNGGEIVLKQARGEVWLLNGGGDIEVDSAAKSVEAHAMQGAIEVAQAGGIVTADTRGGSIRVGSAAGLRAESASGPVQVNNASGPISISAAVGSILASLMVGARLQDSSLVAPSGDITVMIPSNLALSVMATNERGGMPHLESDFSGVRMQSLTFGRPPLAQGTINGGGPVLLLSGSGMIYLRRINK